MLQQATAAGLALAALGAALGAAPAAPAPEPAQMAVPMQAATSQAALPGVALAATAPAVAPHAGVVPASCQPPGRPSDAPLPDDASSVAMDTPASLRESVKALRRQQPVTRLARNHPRTFPECKVTVRPKDSKRFWEEVKRRALEAGDWDLIERVGMPEEERGPEQAATLPQNGVLVDQSDVTMDQGGSDTEGIIQTFPVQKALPNSGQSDKHETFAWKVVQHLQTKVAQYGLVWETEE